MDPASTGHSAALSPLAALSKLWGPLAPTHIIRNRHSENHWVRFHSLPDSKRYADTEAEWEILLDRYHWVLAWLAESSNEGGVTDEDHLVLFTETGSWSAEDIPTPDLFQQWGISHQEYIYSVCSSDFDPEGADEDPYWWFHFYAGYVSRAPSSLNPLLRAVADDEIDNVILAPPTFSWLFCPYDGGMDIFIRSSRDRAALRKRFPSWLSPRPDGL